MNQLLQCNNARNYATGFQAGTGTGGELPVNSDLPLLADTLLPAQVSADAAQRIAAECYGISARASPLPGEYDNNFRLTAESGAGFVLKIMHPSRDPALVDLQVRALQHVALRAPRLPLQRVLPAHSGQAISVVEVAPGVRQAVWAVGYIPGRPLARTRPVTPELLTELGEVIGELTAALGDFAHPAADRDLKWDLARSGWIGAHLHEIADRRRQDIVSACMARFDEEVLPALPTLRRSIIHGDANDYNVLTDAGRSRLPRIVGVIDFGDMHLGLTVADLAITSAYAILGQDEPLAAAAAVVAGYHRLYPLTDLELEVLFPLIMARLCVSVVNSQRRKALAPNDPYVTISERPAWAALEALAAANANLAHRRFRSACGLAAVPDSPAVVEWLRSNTRSFAPLLESMGRPAVLDLGIGSLWTGADPAVLEEPALTSHIAAAMRDAGADMAVGRYDEARGLYTSAAFGDAGRPTRERRCVHLGLDLFAAAGTEIHAPLEGTVIACANNAAAQDYGPVIVLRHAPDRGPGFCTLYGHLSPASLERVSVGQRIAQGEAFAAIGTAQFNGGWTPHVHFQIITDLLGLGTDFPGVARAGERALWLSLSPDPNLIVGIPARYFPGPETPQQATLAERRTRLGGNLRLSYKRPLKIVRGWRQYLFDADGRAYLDAYNNVPVCGHSHPRIVSAVTRQIALLNTNTRYLHDNVLRYAERLTALLPAALRVCYFVNSATEANELALRLVRTRTGRTDMIVLEHAYHGHSSSLIDMSPYKFGGPGGGGRRPWVHVAPIADDYRGAYRRGDPQAGAKYAAHVGQMIAAGVRPAGFIAESLPSVGGQIVFPPGYLAGVYAAVRADGGLCIADEVQTGFARLGDPFWGFETQGVVPDVVVLGKPIGNGFPLGAVVTTADIAAAFDNGMEFFSTFGGNPVACAAGLAVLDVLRDERLGENARRVGAHLRARLDRLLDLYPLVGDVRGLGLFLGVELVRDRDTLEPADDEAGYVVDRLRDEGILAGTDGPYHNVVKIRPPLCFSETDADFLADTLEKILGEDGLDRGSSA
jgi:4-aminobutyrate aminotransferase-like enzyme/Ser/Thr protein kinase RdoA (MazF antagonist)